ncbi:MAG: GDYXXLXY domain-containing protein [Clostridia bacterium]|jgi:uncharacterized membrane-anchored protein|nr:GDYXXLXY domain-containing protein [Clostridia bacterium]
MNKKKLFFGLLICLALIQILMPVRMIVQRETVLATGQQFKLVTVPVDPYDAFRGRYVALRFQEEFAPTDNNFMASYNQKVYAHIVEGTDGFAKFSTVTLQPPENASYLTVQFQYVDYNEGRAIARFILPFDRFYMEEKLAPEAEAAYLKYSQQGANSAYVTVRVKNGLGVLEELYLDGKPVTEFLAGKKQ